MIPDLHVNRDNFLKYGSVGPALNISILSSCIQTLSAKSSRSGLYCCGIWADGNFLATYLIIPLLI